MLVCSEEKTPEGSKTLVMNRAVTLPGTAVPGLSSMLKDALPAASKVPSKTVARSDETVLEGSLKE